MINIESAKEEFLRYTSNYDVNNANIERKITHTLRVADVCGEIASVLGLEEEKIELAWLIGLLHDIARFEQFTRFGTYNDLKSINHGTLGVEILENNEYIRKYIQDDKYDDIIKKAVRNHNAYGLEDGLNEEEILFCNIVRDGDKIDILYQISEVFKNGEEQYSGEEKFSKGTLEQFYNRQLIDNAFKVTKLDGILGVISFVFDFNFIASFKLIKEKDYMNKIIDNLEVCNSDIKNTLEDIKNITNEYIEQKIR